MCACPLTPIDRARQVKLVGDDLVKNYGKKKYYSVREVKEANQRQGIGLDFCCWSHAVFNSHSDFDSYHQSLGESCNYAAMKAEMLSSVSTSTDSSWFDIDLSWLEFPDIDFSIFDFLDF
ncbi:hypothetical protein PL263_17010 [Methylomonas sp. EFPC3]|uniref:DUF6559 family protein n=1 Tax=Methylomonas sp. EFPC3 TaxID=3021710 RepID=UPI002415E38B|nr:DUF6559 family protein [Methylomonas sp. EFPC3]WFP49788.1 hypothetical protein PL263_17010 [Methylomonas sp. EFPC3]